MAASFSAFFSRRERPRRHTNPKSHYKLHRGFDSDVPNPENRSRFTFPYIIVPRINTCKSPNL